MAIINSYPLATPETTDLVLGTKKGSNGRNLTKSFTVASLQAITAGVTSITSSTPTTIVIGGTSQVPTVGATTGAVTQNGTPLATGGQIYDFVINNHPGTVTSVGFDVSALPAFSIAGSPVTSSGTLTLGISGGSAGQFLDYTGNWSTPPDTGSQYSFSNQQNGTSVELDLNNTTNDLSFNGFNPSSSFYYANLNPSLFTEFGTSTPLNPSNGTMNPGTFTSWSGDFEVTFNIGGTSYGPYTYTYLGGTVGNVNVNSSTFRVNPSTSPLTNAYQYQFSAFADGGSSNLTSILVNFNNNSDSITMTKASSTGDSKVTVNAAGGITLTSNSSSAFTISSSSTGGTVTSVTSADTNTLTVTNTTTTPAITAVTTGGVGTGNNNLVTGNQVQTAIDAAVAGGVTFKGGFNANTGVIDGGTDNLTSGGSRVAISVGDLYVVTTAGNFYGDATIPLAIGDQVLCQTAATQGSSTSANWVTIESNVVAATAGATDSATVKGVAGFDNQMFSATSNGYITSTTVNQIPITVANVGGSNYYFVDGTQQADITLMPDVTYFIDQSDSSNNSHPLILSTTSPSQTEYATGVVYLLDNAVVANAAAYNTGFNSATTRQIRVTLTQTAPTLYYVCYNHQNMGGDIGRGGSGSVTSVGLALTSLAALQVSNSPITSSGNIGLTVTGGSAGQYLDYQGNWSTPASGASTRVVNRSTISNATTGTHDCGTVNQTDVNYIDVYVSGVYQNKNTYTAAYDSGTGKTTITLTGGAYYPNGAVVESVTI